PERPKTGPLGSASGELKRALTRSSSALQRAITWSASIPCSFCINGCIYNCCRYNTAYEKPDQAARLYQPEDPPTRSYGVAPLRPLRRCGRAQEHAVFAAVACGDAGTYPPE